MDASTGGLIPYYDGAWVLVNIDGAVRLAVVVAAWKYKQKRCVAYVDDYEMFGCYETIYFRSVSVDDILGYADVVPNNAEEVLTVLEAVYIDWCYGC